MRGIVGLELAEDVGAAALHREQQEGEEVEERQRREDPHVGRRRRDRLRAERRVRGRQAGHEAGERRVGAPRRVDQQVGKDGARGVVRRRRRLVAAVPAEEQVGEGRRGLRGSEDEVRLGLVRVALRGVQCADDVVQVRVAGGVGGGFGGPSIEFSSASGFRKKAEKQQSRKKRKTYSTTPPTNFFFPGSRGGNARSSVTSRALLIVSPSARTPAFA